MERPTFDWLLRLLSCYCRKSFKFSSLIFLNALLISTFLSISAFSQTGVINGKVTGEANTPIVGATVVVKGTTVGTITDNDGNFTLSLPANARSIEVKFIGMKTQEVVLGNRSTFNIQLLPDIVGLDEVVVIGYGTQMRRDITGSVSSISERDITDVPISRMDEALIGRIPGLDVVSTGNNPGDGNQIRLRGRRSFTASNDPLFILDGVPYYGSLTDINPYDIASIDVLKDASSTAIYGSRGANGVIIITTKRGGIGKPKFSLDSYAGPQLHYGRIPYGTGDQYAERGREAFRMAGNYPDPGINDALDKQFFQPEEYENIKAGKWWDYQEMLFQNGWQVKNQLSVDGGTQAVKYNIAANTYNEEGILSGLTFDRYSLRTNLDIVLSPKVNVGTSVLLSYSLRHRDSNLGAIDQAYTNSPLGKPYEDDGTPRFNPVADGTRMHPLADYEFDSYRWDEKRWAGYLSLFGEYRILPTLTYRINLGADVNTRSTKESAGYYSISRNKGTPSAAIDHSIYSRKLYESILTFDKKFNDVHHLTVTAVQGIQTSHGETDAIRVSDLPVEASRYHNVGTAAVINSVGSDLQEWALLSYVGRLFYGFNSRYLLTLSMRADGASQFSPDHKWGYFPSAAIAWRISEESFLKDVAWLSNLKLRLSYGVTGNQAINPYQTQGGLASTIYAWDEAGAFGYRPAELANRELKWESTAVQNIGLDFGFFEGRINGNIEFYNTDTYDLLMRRQLPSNTGYLTVLENIGSTNNLGFELGLNTVNIERNSFKWTTDFSFYLNREKIVELYGGEIDDVGNGWFIGYPILTWFDFEKIGIWQLDEAEEAAKYGRKPGEIKLHDVNEDYKYTDADRKKLGSPQPKFVANMTNRFSYNNWDFSFIGYLRWGGMTRIDPFNPHSQKRYNQLVWDYWTPTNPTNAYPRPNENREGTLDGGTLRYRDGSFFRLRQLSLGYKIPKSALAKTFLNDARIYSTVENPWYWTKSEMKKFNAEPEDPDNIGLMYPALRTVIFGINISF